MLNFIPDHNRFKLAGPPSWFLRRLWDFDSSLVIVPSRQSCVYRLAQRRRLKLSEKLTNDALFNESDTRMLATYGLIPVTSIIPTINWADPAIWRELHNRAPHRIGGADAAIKAVEAQDAADELKVRAKNDDMLQWLAKDSWQMYRKKAGLQTHGFSVRTKSDLVPPAAKAPALRIVNTNRSTTFVP